MGDNAKIEEILNGEDLLDVNVGIGCIFSCPPDLLDLQPSHPYTTLRNMVE